MRSKENDIDWGKVIKSFVEDCKRQGIGQPEGCRPNMGHTACDASEAEVKTLKDWQRRAVIEIKRVKLKYGGLLNRSIYAALVELVAEAEKE